MSISRRCLLRISLFVLPKEAVNHIFKTVSGLFALVELDPRVFRHADVLVSIASHIEHQHGHRHKQLPTIDRVNCVNHVYHEYMSNLFVRACKR